MMSWLQCDQCEYSSNRKSNLQQHVSSVHDKTQQFPCPQCPFRSTRKANVKHHIQTVHQQLKTFHCSHCNFKSARKYNLVQHERRMHKEEQIKHDTVPQAVQTTNVVTQTTFSLPPNLMNMAYLQPVPPQFINLQSSPYLNSNQNPDSLLTKAKNFHCDICPFRTAYKRNLTSHVNEVHFKDRRVLHQCQFCSFSFTRKSNLNQHVKSIHEQHRDFKCQVCDFTSTRKRNVQIHHMKIHGKHQ